MQVRGGQVAQDLADAVRGRVHAHVGPDRAALAQSAAPGDPEPAQGQVERRGERQAVAAGGGARRGLGEGGAAHGHTVAQAVQVRSRICWSSLLLLLLLFAAAVVVAVGGVVVVGGGGVGGGGGIVFIRSKIMIA